jgi:RHS repeat-associated protein
MAECVIGAGKFERRHWIRYDTLNRLSTLTPPSAFTTGSFGFTYDALSRRTQMTRPNNVTTDYAYDNLSRLLSVLHKLSGCTIDGASYTVDAVGNRTAKVNHLPSAPSEAYTYDAIYQLTQVVQNGSTTSESYTYDPVGNRLSSLAASPWNYNVSNQLTSITGSPGTTLTYDSNGNTTSKTDAAGTTTYTWDYENRLTSVTLPNSGGTVSFTYDPLGRRIRKVSASATTIYVYDGNDVLETVSASGSATSRYVHGEGLDEPLAELAGAASSFYVADGLGSITSLTDSNGSVVGSYVYDSYGKAVSATGSVTQPFRFAARELDSETGLYFLRARYYESLTGRFLNEDPIGFLGGANFYAYVENNPVGFIDPLGLEAWPITQKWTPEKIAAYSKFMRDFVRNYTDPIDCADLVLLGLIDFASQNGLRVNLKTYSGGGWKYYDSASKSFNTVDEYKQAVLRDLGALAVIDNTRAVSPSDLRAGDVLMTQYPGGQIGHTRVVTDVQCAGNCSDPNVTYYYGNLPPTSPVPDTRSLSKVPGGALSATQIPRRWNFGKW